MDARTAAFIAVAAVLAITLSTDFAVAVCNAPRGQPQGLVTSAGTAGGRLVHTSTAALGLSAVLAAALAVVEVAGGPVPALTGRPRPVAHQDDPHPPGAPSRRDRRSRQDGQITRSQPGLQNGAAASPAARRTGSRSDLLTNVLDPEAPHTVLSVLPQSEPPDAAVLPRTVLLCGIHLALAAAFHTTLSTVVARVQEVLPRAVIRRRLDRVIGFVLLTLGVRVALEHRPVPA